MSLIFSKIKCFQHIGKQEETVTKSKDMRSKEVMENTINNSKTSEYYYSIDKESMKRV